MDSGNPLHPRPWISFAFFTFCTGCISLFSLRLPTNYIFFRHLPILLISTFDQSSSILSFKDVVLHPQSPYCHRPCDWSFRFAFAKEQVEQCWF